MNVMQQAARKASRRLVRDFGEVENLQVSRKGPSDFVTAADVRTDEMLRDLLLQARPDFGFLTEENKPSVFVGTPHLEKIFGPVLGIMSKKEWDLF